MEPQISVIIPTYRRPHMLRHALASVKMQTLSDFEVLVCDNGSDPETEQLVRSYGDDRMRYVPREHNLGMLRNAILGFTQASAKIVMKLDDDDMLFPDSLEALVAPFNERPDLGLSFGAVRLIDDIGDEMVRETIALSRTSGREGMSKGLIDNGTQAVVRGAVQLAGSALRADAVDWTAIPDEAATAYDLHLTLSAVQDSLAIYYTDQSVISYRIHGESDTVRQLGRQAQGACHVLEKALASGRHEDQQVLKDRLASVSLDAGRALFQQKNTHDARAHLRRSMELAPSAAAATLLALSYLPSAVASRLPFSRSERHRHRSGPTTVGTAR